MATTPATPVNKAARLRKMAEDTSLPQAVRNEYLDKANALEKEAAKPTMAKGGAVMPVRGSRTAKHKETKMMGGGYAMKTPAMAKGGAVKKPSVAIMIAVGKPKEKMAKGGMAKKKC